MSKKLILAASSAALVVPLAIAATPAQAARANWDTEITARTSDSTPASGESFTVRGKFIDAGSPATHQTVKVQALRNDRWVQLDGAQVSTDEAGRYRVRLILSQTGKRELRVVGVADSAGPNARERFTVRVH